MDSSCSIPGRSVLLLFRCTPAWLLFSSHNSVATLLIEISRTHCLAYKKTADSHLHGSFFAAPTTPADRYSGRRGASGYRETDAKEGGEKCCTS